ncbi:unnamed protein product, partial [marine sediment metagenome]
ATILCNSILCMSEYLELVKKLKGDFENERNKKYKYLCYSCDV